MLLRHKRDLTAEIRSIFEEGARIENAYFEPVVTALAEKLRAGGLSRRQWRRALKAGLNAAERQHVEMNLAAFGLFDVDLNTKAHLRRPLPLRKGVRTCTFVFLALLNSITVAGMIGAALETYEVTASRLMAAGVGLLGVAVLSVVIRLGVGAAVSVALRFQRAETPQETAAKRRAEDERAHVKRISPPPIATAPLTAHKIGIRRFRRRVVRAAAVYVALTTGAYAVSYSWRAALILAAAPLVIILTYAQLRPLRTSFDALVFAMLHPPRDARRSPKTRSNV